MLEFDPEQRFFGLGLLKLRSTGPLYEELHALRVRVQTAIKDYELKLRERANKRGGALPAEVKARLVERRRLFEFKFREVLPWNRAFYKEFLEIYFKSPDAQFCALIIDKLDPKFDLEKFFPDPWAAYISFSKMLIRNNMKRGGQICVIADQHPRPLASRQRYELEVSRLPCVFDACMIESHACIFVQLVDVLMGCVILDFKLSRIKGYKANRFKLSLAELLHEKVGVSSLAGEITRPSPNYFSVWPFKMSRNVPSIDS